MSIATLLNDVKTARTHRLETKTEAFDSLARKVADDSPLDPDSVVETLDELGRSAEELSDAAQRIVSRREWEAQLPRDAELLAEHNKLHAEQLAADAELAETIRKANAAHAARVGPIQQRLVNIVREQDAGQTARNRLLQTSPQWARLSKLGAERTELVIDLQERLPRELRQSRPGDKGHWAGEIQRTQAKAAQLAIESAKLEAEALRP